MELKTTSRDIWDSGSAVLLTKRSAIRISRAGVGLAMVSTGKTGVVHNTKTQHTNDNNPQMR